MRIEFTVAEAWEIAQASGSLPSFVTSISGEESTIRFALDLRLFPNPPSALKLAAKLVPVVRGSLWLDDFTAGTAVFAVDASAGGVPVSKMLSFAEGPVKARLRAKGIAPEAVEILQNGRIAVDTQAFVQRFAGRRLPGLQVTHLAIADATILLSASL